MIAAQVERWSDCLPELIRIFPEHYDALALNKEHVPLSPCFDTYARMEDNGSLMLVTLRETGKLIGYFVGILQRSLHYSTCYECKMDIFWVSPPYRGRHAGKRLFKAVEHELRRRGVQRWHVGSKVHSDASRLFVALGFVPTETYFSKWLA